MGDLKNGEKCCGVKEACFVGSVAQHKRIARASESASWPATLSFLSEILNLPNENRIRRRAGILFAAHRDTTPRSRQKRRLLPA